MGRCGGLSVGQTGTGHDYYRPVCTYIFIYSYIYIIAIHIVIYTYIPIYIIIAIRSHIGPVKAIQSHKNVDMSNLSVTTHLL